MISPAAAPMRGARLLGALTIGWLALVVDARAAQAQSQGPTPAQALLAAYPSQLSHIDGNDLVWRDGTRMTIDDGRGAKSYEEMLLRPDLKDMLQMGYPAGRSWPTPPRIEGGRIPDPGRIRNSDFFTKMYGDCAKGSVTRHLVEVVWLPNIAPQRLLVTRVNGVADKLTAVSRELEALSASFRPYLVPSAGAFVCRPIAGTERTSAHGWGIAIDIAVARSDYWRWQKGAGKGPEGTATAKAITWRNRVPAEIIEIFERHGFIWGGKWLHYDTMHFEYRPELLASAR